MKKRTRNLFLGSGAAVAGIAAAKIAVDALARYLVSIALDRDLPPSPKRGQARLTGSGTDDALLERMRDAAAALENAGCETVTITAHDGVQLVGHWQTCEEPERVIIAMHGWRSTWAKDFGVVAESWHKQHCNVLYVEQRGQDGSGGDYMGFGLLERYDCLDWINWVNQAGHSVYEGRRLPIYLCGVSMGATSVLMAAGLPLPANVRGIIADCGFTSPPCDLEACGGAKSALALFSLGEYRQRHLQTEDPGRNAGVLDTGRNGTLHSACPVHSWDG